MRILLGLAGALLATSVLIPSMSEAAADSQRVRTVHRAYGDGPVRLGSEDVLAIRFEGRRGNRVRLGGKEDCHVWLRSPGGHQVAKLSMGFWRLPRAGSYTFILRRCDSLSNNDRVQLEKLRVKALAMNGEGKRLGATRGFVDAVRVRVPQSGRLKVVGTDPRAPYMTGFSGMVLPDGTWFPSGWNTYYFESGRRISTFFGPLSTASGDGSLKTAGGDKVVLVVEQRLTVWQSTAIPISTTIDGPTVTLPASPVPYREYQVEYDAPADAWLHPEVIWPSTGVPAFGGWIGADGSDSYRHITNTGHYRLNLFTLGTTEPTQIRLRTIRQLGTPMPVEGTHLTITSDDPGQWVMVPMTFPETGSAFYRMNVHSFTATGHWSALATAETGVRCGRRSGNDCGRWLRGEVSPESLTSSSFGPGSGAANPWLVILQPDPGVTATVELSVSPSTMDRPQ